MKKITYKELHWAAIESKNADAWHAGCEQSMPQRQLCKHGGKRAVHALPTSYKSLQWGVHPKGEYIPEVRTFQKRENNLEGEYILNIFKGVKFPKGVHPKGAKSTLGMTKP